MSFLRGNGLALPSRSLASALEELDEVRSGHDQCPAVRESEKCIYIYTLLSSRTLLFQATVGLCVVSSS